MTSDDIWRQFGIATWRGYAGRLSIVVMACLMLVIAGTGVWSTGAVIPVIRWEPQTFFVHAEPDKSGVLMSRLLMDLENEGSAAVTITDVWADIPGLRFLPVEAERQDSAAVTVAAGGFKSLTRHVAVVDCAAVPDEPQPIHFSYRTWLTSGTAEVTWDSWRLDGPPGKVPIAWQRGFAGQLCNEAVNSDWF